MVAGMTIRNLDGMGRRPHEWRDRWRAYLTVGYKRDGKPERRYVYGLTAEECQQRLDALRAEAANGALSGKAPPRLSAWLDHWLKEREGSIKARSVVIYRYDLGNLPEKLKRTRLDKITPLQVSAALTQVSDDMSARAANAARGALSSALRDAVRYGIINRNPVTPVRSVAYHPADITVWTAAQVAAFLRVTEAADSTYHALFYTALTTGARMGELFALTWADLDGDVLRIERTYSGQGKARRIETPKTKAGRRLVHLSGDTVAVMTRKRAVLKGLGIPPGPHALIFPSGDGGPLNHSNTRRALHHWADKASAPRIRPHDLRHTYASMAIAQGVTAPELARQLGHTDPGFTLKRYVHYFERYAPRAALGLPDLLGAPSEPTGGIEGGTSAGEPS